MYICLTYVLYNSYQVGTVSLHFRFPLNCFIVNPPLYMPLDIGIYYYATGKICSISRM